MILLSVSVWIGRIWKVDDRKLRACNHGQVFRRALRLSSRPS